MPDYPIYRNEHQLFGSKENINAYNRRWQESFETSNQNAMNKKEVTGEIRIKHIVQCPHCSAILDDNWDEKWFRMIMGDDFPTKGGYDVDYNAQCQKCKNLFTIKGFQY